MNLTTKRDLILAVPERWRQQYTPFSRWDSEKERIAHQLDALDVKAATEDDVERIIGNRSWTCMKCDECKQEVDSLVQVGEPLDYESRTAHLCLTCICAAHTLIAPTP